MSSSVGSRPSSTFGRSPGRHPPAGPARRGGGSCRTPPSGAAGRRCAPRAAVRQRAHLRLIPVARLRRRRHRRPAGATAGRCPPPAAVPRDRPAACRGRLPAHAPAARGGCRLAQLPEGPPLGSASLLSSSTISASTTSSAPARHRRSAAGRRRQPPAARRTSPSPWRWRPWPARRPRCGSPRCHCRRRPPAARRASPRRRP